MPQNRKLRHLQGITFRNLNLDPPQGRTRGTTIDDEALPYALRSPVKLLAGKERRSLAHSRSSDNLKSANDSREDALDLSPTPTKDSTRISPQKRPRKPRRKSTLEWSNTSAAERHEDLLDAVSRKTADVFFSLHLPSLKNPIYISELVENATNPNFRAFDLRVASSTVSRRDDLIIKIWAKGSAAGSWSLLVEEHVNLRTLELLDETLEGISQPLEDNALILHLPDGLYISPSSFQNGDVEGKGPVPQDLGPISAHAEPTSSYDALTRLATLDDCIQEAIKTRTRLTAEINTLIEQDKRGHAGKDKVKSKQSDLDRVEAAVETERRTSKSTRTRLSEMRSELNARREAMTRARAAQTAASESLISNRPQLEGLREAHSHLQHDLTAQRARICTSLSSIYPIEPIPKKSLSFTIRGLHLPNSDFTSVNENAISAALGHVAHIVHLLSLYLSIPLPYPTLPSSSTSTIQDPISIIPQGSRIFPLYIPKSIHYRFEYAVFLLNKDVELLASKLGVKVLDLRQTLPNLKYCFFVATEVKGGDSGGVGGRKGVLAAHTEKDLGTPEEGSKRSSFEGDQPSLGAASLRQRLMGAEGKKPATVLLPQQNGSATKSRT